MSFVRPHALAEVHPDTVRIVALSAAIALNAAALIAVMRPVVANLAVAPPAAPVIRLIDHPVQPAVVPPPPLDLKPLPVRRAIPRTPTVERPAPVTPITQAPSTDEGMAPAVPAEPTVDAPPAQTAAPVEATLAYVAAPPPTYPRVAIGARMQGTVTLRVLVDESGRPLDVVVETSSGHPVLDKAAREQVLANWRFQPATAGGRPVKAWARIPVTFGLRSP